MRKTMIGVWVAVIGTSCASLAHAVLPPFLSLIDLRSLVTAKSESSVWIKDNPENAIGDRSLFIVFASEGSGIIHEFAYVYECAHGQCALLALARAIREGSEGMGYKYDATKTSISLLPGNRVIATVNVP